MSSRLGAYAVTTAEQAAQDTEQQSAAGRAVEYIRSKWAAFVALDRQMLDLMAASSRVAAAARQRGDDETYELARASLDRLAELRRLHDRALQMFDQLRAGVPGLGALPVVPLALVGVALALAALVAWIFTRATAEEKIVRLLELGQLTPAEAERLLMEADQPGGAESFTTAVKWILGGLLVLAVLKTIRETTR